MEIATKKVQTTEVNICPVCGADRQQLRKWLTEPLVWEHWPNPESGGTWFRSQTCQKALEIIGKCSKCQEYFREE